MPPAARGRYVAGEVLVAIGREYRGVDIAVAIAPEADAVAPERVVVDVVIGERPEQRTHPSIPTITMLPPSARATAAVPARQRGGSSDLHPRHRLRDPVGAAGEIGARQRAGRLVMEVCHSDALAAPAMQASKSQRGNGSHNADGAAANPHVQASRLSGARRRDDQNQKQAGRSQNDDSNREFRHGTLPALPISARRERPMEPKVPEGNQPRSNASSTRWFHANPEGNRLCTSSKASSLPIHGLATSLT